MRVLLTFMEVTSGITCSHIAQRGSHALTLSTAHSLYQHKT